GISRVVLTSSVAASHHGSGRAPFTERDWTDPQGPRATAYYRSKTLAEIAAWSAAADSGTELAVINPGVILGPIVTPRVGASLGLVLGLLRGDLRRVPRFGFAVVDVRDAASAHLAAMTAPAAINQRFLLGGETVWLRELSARLARLRPEYAAALPRAQSPDWTVRLLALRDPKAREIVRELGRDLGVDARNARTRLGWSPRPLDETLTETVRALESFGHLAPPTGPAGQRRRGAQPTGTPQ
ncbi:NAD-dependent epimerase/dehydratase family protein, partial [Leucobacter sp. M11]|uniref:NAD-dependent epimerase/dehydratase family protein n=1 Tax=Leucobacter sp. M11 TaxID=2993565 RepID=UPI002D7E98ED